MRPTFTVQHEGHTFTGVMVQGVELDEYGWATASFTADGAEGDLTAEPSEVARLLDRGRCYASTSRIGRSSATWARTLTSG